MTRLDETPGHLLRRVHQTHNALWTELVGSRPTSPQYALLQAVARTPGIDQRAAGDEASLDSSSTMDVVARLERAGWIERSRDARDARRDALRVTGDATAVLAESAGAVNEVQRMLLAALTPAKHATFLSDLARVAQLPTGTAPDSPQRIPGHLVRRAQQVHTALFAQEVPAPMTGPQYAALVAVHTAGTIGQRELGEFAALDRSTAGDLVGRMVDRGWLTRERDPHDGRRRLLELTPSGHDARAAAAPQVAKVQRLLLEPLSPAHAKRFVGALSRLAQSV